MAKGTIKFGDKDYSLVPERLKKFREENPRSDIDTVHIVQADSSTTFKARIVKDQADEYSAKATGSSRYTAEEMKLKKAFEKLETIAVGRALANLGYLNDGQIATTEEMEEFEAFKADKLTEAIDKALADIKKSKTIDALKKVFMALPAEVKADENVMKAKDKKKSELTDENS